MIKMSAKAQRAEDDVLEGVDDRIGAEDVLEVADLVAGSFIRGFQVLPFGLVRELTDLVVLPGRLASRSGLRLDPGEMWDNGVLWKNNDPTKTRGWRRGELAIGLAEMLVGEPE